ncbi:MAG: nitrogen fixation protein NifU [Acidobacteriota bacterium]|jgi:nitrogen fixation NifU-like protein|nr:nitrogen fixation protein NifU [Acidobacteriota bacterium]
MASPIYELYNEQVIEHSKKPRNYREMDAANRKAEGVNPLCGDHQIIYLQVEDDVIKDISFICIGEDKVKNCAISKSSASMMTRSLKGKTLKDADTLFNGFHEMLTGELNEAAQDKLGHLGVFAGVRKFPERVKCATLPWHTMRAALNNQEVASTEGALDPASSAGG